MTIPIRSGAVAASRRYAMELVRPSSVVAAGAGSSATIVGLGSVDFSTCTAVSLNGVFSAEYDNYMISMRHLGSTTAQVGNVRLRSSGTDNTTASSYTRQYFQANGTTFTGERLSSDTAFVFSVVNEQRSGFTMFIYGPHLSQPTSGRTNQASGYLGGYILDSAFTHNQTASYDGITFYPASGTFAGNIAVYGLRG